VTSSITRISLSLTCHLIFKSLFVIVYLLFIWYRVLKSIGWSARDVVARLQVSLIVMLVWLRRALIMLLGEVSAMIVLVIRMRAPTVLMIMWSGLKSMAWPLMIASRGIP
jgi:hypothetical protein